MFQDWPKEIVNQGSDIEMRRLLDNKGNKTKKNYYIVKEVLTNNFLVDEYDDEKYYLTIRLKKSRDTIDAVVYKDCLYLIHHSPSLVECVLDVTMGRSEATYYELLWNISKYFSEKLTPSGLCTLIYFATVGDLYNVSVIIKRIIKRQNNEINEFLKLVDKVKGI